MIYLALDQALKTTGFSIYDDDKLIGGGTIDIKTTIPIEQRLATLGTHLNILNEKYDFKYVFFEDIQHQTNMETYKKLCYVQAAILLGCCNNDMKYSILSPSHGRSVLKDKYGVNFGRKRKEQKKAALNGVSNKYDCGDCPFTEDEADAICIGAAGLVEYDQSRSAF